MGGAEFARPLLLFVTVRAGDRSTVTECVEYAMGAMPDSTTVKESDEDLVEKRAG